MIKAFFYFLNLLPNIGMNSAFTNVKTFENQDFMNIYCH
uniref:Uncharacterized protein n=1 Tax=Carnobacterium maltaromaticum TaxID=2751 RepID=Q9REY8_CARML|nr:unknown [Carnobacterium maltaromaticum]